MTEDKDRINLDSVNLTVKDFKIIDPVTVERVRVGAAVSHDGGTFWPICEVADCGWEDEPDESSVEARRAVVRHWKATHGPKPPPPQWQPRRPEDRG
jgi:hypothetical protein